MLNQATCHKHAQMSEGIAQWFLTSALGREQSNSHCGQGHFTPENNHHHPLDKRLGGH